MITNDSDLKRKNVSVQLTEHITSIIKPIKTFHMHSDETLQFVFTKTFLNMLDTITKTLRIEDDSSEPSLERDDYDLLENEEDMLIEKYRDNIGKNPQDELANSDLEEFEEADADDKYDDNPSFNFLVKNELGFEVSLEAVSGFKFQNIDLANSDSKREINIDKINLKDGNSCPITIKNRLDNSFTYRSNNQTIENSEAEKKSMKFNLNVCCFFCLFNQ
jgi:hypothetical protein